MGSYQNAINSPGRGSQRGVRHTSNLFDFSPPKSGQSSQSNLFDYRAASLSLLKADRKELGVDELGVKATDRKNTTECLGT